MLVFPIFAIKKVMCENFADNSGISKPEHRKDIPFELEKNYKYNMNHVVGLYTPKEPMLKIFFIRGLIISCYFLPYLLA